MKTSLLVLSMLMASTNAIDIQAAPAAVPHAAKAAAPKDADPVVAKKAPAAPHITDPDHKVDTPEHHVVAKGHVDIKKAAAAKAPVVKDDDKAPVVDDDDVAKADDKAAAPKDSKCMTNSCKAARAIKKLDAKKDDAKIPKPDAVVKIDDLKDDKPVHEAAKPKMVVVHKAEAKKAAVAKPEAHKVHVSIKTRPAAKHHAADPTTIAH
jgi:hypothetical protein